MSLTLTFENKLRKLSARSINWKAIDLHFGSIELDENTQQAGIYCIYAVYNNEWRRLLYIGESANIYQRLCRHEKLECWESYVNQGENLVCLYAKVDDENDRKRAEAVLIYKEKPECNIEYKDNCPFPSTQIIVQGEKGLLKKFYLHIP